jgi:molybdenum cofactor cytidylyltransferase
MIGIPPVAADSFSLRQSDQTLMHHIAAIVLAAGSSRRFGTDKLLHSLGQGQEAMPLAARSLLPWLQTFNQVTVVVREDSERLQDAVAQALGPERAARIHWQPCPDSDLGMSASLVEGVSAHLQAAGWLVGLADMPAVPPEVIATVGSAIAGGALLAAPYFHGKRGHPVGFSAHYLEDLLALEGDTGARRILVRDAEWLHPIETDNPGILYDIDSPEDLQRPL